MPPDDSLRYWTVLALALVMPVKAGEIDAEEARALLGAGQIQSLEAILERALEHQPGRLLDVELEREDGRYVYELELLDEEGYVWELELDASTGELLEREREH